MANGAKFTFVSLACGSGGTIQGLVQAGGKPCFVCDPRTLELSNTLANFQKVPHEKVDARWFYNRKQRGTADLLERMGLKQGELDVMEASVRFSGRNAASKSLPSLYDLFGLAKRLMPKLVLIFGPSNLVKDKNLSLLDRQVDFLRFASLKEPQLKRNYYVAYRGLNSSDFGAAVSKTYTVIIAVREDIATTHQVAADRAVLELFPSLATETVATLGSALSGKVPPSGEEEFWENETLGNPNLQKAAKFLPKNPNTILWLPSYGPKQLKTLGYKQTEATKVYRTSLNQPAPDIDFYNPKEPEKWGLLHPTKNRMLTASEISSAVGLPTEYKLLGNDYQKAQAAAETIPPILVSVIAKSLQPLLASTPKNNKIKKTLDTDAFKIQLVETLRSSTPSIKSYHCDVDLGDGHARNLEGKMPTEAHFDYLFDADEIGEDFVVYGPVDPTTGQRPVIGGVKRRVFDGENHKQMVAAITKVKGKSEYRGMCSPEPIRPELLDRYVKENRKLELSADQRQFRLWVEAKPNSPAHWDRWRTNPIPSATEGWSLDKNTRKPQLSKALANDPELKVDFEQLNIRAEYAYLKIAPVEFKKQRKFLQSRVKAEYRLGKTVFTSLAINKYGQEMPAMNFHIDSGDNNSGLTSISVFNKGQYDGGYFVMPQYRCAFKVGDGDVFVGNSRKVHGITRVVGSGKRMSVVSYANTALGYKEYADKAYPPRSPRPNFRIDQYQIAIPSYKRSHLIKAKVLAFLERQNIDPKRVTIFVANDKERKLYEKELTECRYQKIVVGEPGIMEIRNFIRRFYKENTPVVSLDDDLMDIMELDESRVYPMASGGLEKLIFLGFNAAREHNAYLWGISNTMNPFYMSDTIQIGLYFVVGQLFGTIIRHDKDLMVTTDMKEDVERCLQHFVKDGRLIRLDQYGPKANYNTLEGGQQSVRSHSNQFKSAAYLTAKYPKYLRMYYRKAGKGNTKGQAELRFIDEE